VIGSAVRSDLAALLGAESVLPDVPAHYLVDATESRGVRGRSDAVVLPETAEGVVRAVSWCFEHGVPIVPRGGGTGFAGGAVPVDGGVVLGLERLRQIRALDPHAWRMTVEAGVPTATVRRLARENGLFFPPDPGAAEQSQIGGNIATNAGGPHAFKYGVTGEWVLGVEAVVPPGELVSFGGPIRKDAAGYDLASLMIGSEGTLGVITAAWLRLIPAPEATLSVAAFYPGLERGCEAVAEVVGSGVGVAALEFLDNGTLTAAAHSFPGGAPQGAGFLVLADADGSDAEAAHVRDEAVEMLRPGALRVDTPSDQKAAEAIWSWRDGVSLAVTARHGGKLSEDIVVPFERLREAIEGTLEIGARHGLEACSWGHAGDGNLHSTFMFAREDEEAVTRAEAAAEELFSLAVALGGSISGEHGIGLTKRGRLALQWSPQALALHRAVKQAFDPENLLNPGKKL
jgi:glycolate oxidase subunit GlcD